MYLNQNGLAIGGTSPSANLEVHGNAIISQLNIGSPNTSNANLNLSGTMAFGVQSVSSNATIDQYSYIMADTTAGNITLTLPDTDAIIGRHYTLKMKSNMNQINLYGGNCTIDGEHGYLITSQQNNYPSIRLVASSTNTYYSLGSMGNLNPYKLASWNADQTSGVNPSVTPSGYSMSVLSDKRGVGSVMNDGVATYAYRITGYDNSVEDYWSFNLAKDSGSFTLMNMTFNIRRQNPTSASNWVLRSSADAYASDLATGALNSGAPPVSVGTIDLSSLAAQSNITFRVYGTGGGTGGFQSLNKIKIYVQ